MGSLCTNMEGDQPFFRSTTSRPAKLKSKASKVKKQAQCGAPTYSMAVCFSVFWGLLSIFFSILFFTLWFSLCCWQWTVISRYRDFRDYR